MNFLKYLLIFIFSLVLLGGVGYLYASSGVKSNPGYVEFDAPRGSFINTQISLQLGPRGMQPIRWLVERFAKEKSRGELEMPERVLLSILPEIQGVQLSVYEVENNRQSFDDAMQESAGKLRARDWTTLLRVQEDEENVVVMQHGDETKIAGLAILVSTPENAVFMNLIGPFQPESIVAAAESMK